MLRDLTEVESLPAGESSRRRSRLYLSRPYQHYQLRELIQETQADLTCLNDATKPIEREMQCWAQLAGRLLEEERFRVGLSVLRNARIVPSDGDMPVLAQDPTVWYGEYARGIVESIVVPWLTQAANSVEEGTP